VIEQENCSNAVAGGYINEVRFQRAFNFVLFPTEMKLTLFYAFIPSYMYEVQSDLFE